ncbi:MAG: KilA-N domain-containing protein, partial [Candidatus Nanopelagicaceae bacterium]
MNIIKHDYQGSTISQDADGYVSLTDMAKASGKLVADYLRLNSTQNYLEALSIDMGIPISALCKTFKGGNDKQGTWAHPEIAIDFAQWCNPQFRIWANRTLKNALEKRSVSFQHNFEWFERLKLYRRHTKIPTGWFSVFEEMC